MLNHIKHYFQVQIYSTSTGRTALEFTEKHFTKNLAIFDLMNVDACMDNLLQFYLQASSNSQLKYRELRKLLEYIMLDKILIFIRYKNEAVYVYESLLQDGHKVILLSSKSSTASRLDAIKSFNASRNEQIIFILNYPVSLLQLKQTFQLDLLHWFGLPDFC